MAEESLANVENEKLKPLAVKLAKAYAQLQEADRAKRAVIADEIDAPLAESRAVTKPACQKAARAAANCENAMNALYAEAKKLNKHLFPTRNDLGGSYAAWENAKRAGKEVLETALNALVLKQATQADIETPDDGRYFGSSRGVRV